MLSALAALGCGLAAVQGDFLFVAIFGVTCAVTIIEAIIRRTPLQWVIVALVQALNVVAIEALVTDLHPGAQRAHARKFLDGEPDRLRCGRKAAIG